MIQLSVGVTIAQSPLFLLFAVPFLDLFPPPLLLHHVLRFCVDVFFTSDVGVGVGRDRGGGFIYLFDHSWNGWLQMRCPLPVWWMGICCIEINSAEPTLQNTTEAFLMAILFGLILFIPTFRMAYMKYFKALKDSSLCKKIAPCLAPNQFYIKKIGSSHSYVLRRCNEVSTFNYISLSGAQKIRHIL